MERLRKCPYITAIPAPRVDLNRIWSIMPKTEQDYVTKLIGEIHSLANYKVEWHLLEALTDFWNSEKAVFIINGMELTPTLEEYRQLVQGAEWNKGIVMPQFEATEKCILSKLLQTKKWSVADDLMVDTDQGLSIKLLINWIDLRIKDGRTIRRATHAYLLLFFGTLLFPYSQSHVDVALASVVLQVVEGRGFVVALLAETIASLNFIKAKGRGKLRASPALLQIWFLSHFKEIGAGFPKVRYLIDGEIISRMIGYAPHVARGWNALEWKQHFSKLLPENIVWEARWFSKGPAIISCKDFKGVPLISHLRSTVTYPARVIRQLGGLQGIPAVPEGNRFTFDWQDNKVTQATLKEAAKRVRGIWEARKEEKMQLPLELTEDEKTYRATKEYIRRFHTVPDVPIVNPTEIIGPRPQDPNPSHEDIYETLAARVEIQSAAWAKECEESKEEIERLRKELSEARATIRHQKLVLKRKERRRSQLNARLQKFKQRATRIKLFSKHLSVAFVRTKEQALDALGELRSRVKRLRS